MARHGQSRCAVPDTVWRRFGEATTHARRRRPLLSICLAILTLSADQASSQRDPAPTDSRTGLTTLPQPGSAPFSVVRNQVRDFVRNEMASGSTRFDVRTYRFLPTGDDLQYALHVPRRAQGDGPGALVVVLHQPYPTNALDRLYAEAWSRGYSTLVPMGYRLGGWHSFSRHERGSPFGHSVSELSELEALTALALVRNEFDFDPGRIYLVGSSEGAAGALHLGMRHSQIWSAVVAIWPDLPDQVPVDVNNLSNLPVLVLHRRIDGSDTPANLSEWMQRLGEADVPVEYLEVRRIPLVRAVRDIFDFLDRHD